MKKKTKLPIIMKNSDYKNFEKKLKNLKRAMKVNVVITLKYFQKTCVEPGTNLKRYCYYLFETEGYLTVIEHFKKFIEKEEAVKILLQIIDSCLKSLPDDDLSYKIANTDITTLLIDFIKNSKFDDLKQYAYDILSKLSMFENNQEIMVKQGCLEFLDKTIEDLNAKEKIELKKDELIKIAQIMEMVKHFGFNEDIISEISKSGIISDMIQIYTKNNTVSFLSDVVVDTLRKITENDEILEIVKSSGLDLIKLSSDVLKSRNAKMIKKVEILVVNLAQEEELKKYIEKAKKKECDESLIIYLAFISSNEKYSDFFEEKSFLENLIEKLTLKHSSQELKYSIIKIIKDVIEIDERHFDDFDKNDGLKLIIDAIENKNEKKDNYLFIIQILNLFTKCLRIRGKEFSDILNKNNILEKFIRYFLNLKKQYVIFKRKDLNTVLALDSIEYNQCETSKALLLTQKEIKEDKMVSIEMALTYISCEELSKSLMIFFGKFLEIDREKKLDVEDEFFENSLLLLKVFKNSKKIYETVLNCLNKIQYTIDQAKCLINLKIGTFLCDKIWLKSNWRFFSLYVLRFYEVLTNNEDILVILRANMSSVKLVASIKNFINEQEYQEFEEADDDDAQIDEEVIEKDIFSFSEEREIHKKSAEIMKKLLEISIIDTFKRTISTNINRFRPIKETILILRAEYAVLTCANGINHFGSEGLNGNLQDWLKENIEKIEKASKYRDFPDKEKLIADCIRCIANYICITWNENGKNLYEQKEISIIVFRLFENYLKKSDWPLKSYVMLQAFKEWLIERIEIIENTNNLMRMKIYDPKSFLMVNPKIKDKLITDVMDSLYVTQQKFASNAKVCKINFEVIILLGYIYPEWKFRVGKNFVPLILEALDSDTLPEDVDIKSIDLLKHLAGVDGKSDEPNLEIFKAIADKGGIQTITKSISDNNYNEEYIEHCRPLLEGLGENPNNLEDSYKVIDDLIAQIDEFNKNSDFGDKEQLEKIIKANDQLNAYTILDPLRIYAFDNGHVDVVKNFWDGINNKKKEKNRELKQILKKAENSAIISASQHLKSAKSNKNKIKYFGEQGSEDNLIINALKSLQKSKKDPEKVFLLSKIINKCFPSENAQKTRDIAKKINFQPDLEIIFKLHNKNKNADISSEVMNLYMNLSEVQNDDMIEKIIKKNLRKLNQDLKEDNLEGCINCLNSLLPFINHKVFKEKFDEFNVLDYILKMLKLLHKNTKEKSKKDSKELVDHSLGAKQSPDLGLNIRQLLSKEIPLAKNLTSFILKLSEDQKIKVRKSSEIVKLSDILGVLNGSCETFELFQEYLQENTNKKILKEEKIIECATFLLMKNNKDSFKKEELEDTKDLMVSTLSIVKKPEIKEEVVKVNDLNKSQMVFKKIEDNRDNVLVQNLDGFCDLISDLLDKEIFNDLVEKYIKAMMDFKLNDTSALANLLSISRIISALVMGVVDEDLINFEPYADRLNKAFSVLLKRLEGKKVPNKKLLKFFENNFNHIAKKVGNKFKDKKLWNKMVRRYFIISPGLIKNNNLIIFENLNLTYPPRKEEIKSKDKFIEKKAEIEIYPVLNEKGPLNDKNSENTKLIVANFYKSFSKNPVPADHILNNLECLSRSCSFCREFVKSSYFNLFIDKLIETIDPEKPKIFDKNTNVLINVANAIYIEKLKDNNELMNEFYKITTEKLFRPFIKNIKEGKKALLTKSFMVLSYLDEVVKNKSLYFDENFPKTLFDYLGDNWSGKEDALVLLCKTLNDSSLHSKYDDLNLFGIIRENLEKELFNNKSIIRNHDDFSNYKKLSDLEPDLKKRNIELKAYILGELSRNDKYSILFANLEDKKFKNSFQLYNEFLNFGHITILGTKLIQATRNGIYQLNEEQLDENEDIVEKMIEELPFEIQKYSEFKKTRTFLEEILDFLKNYNKNKIPKTALARLIKDVLEKNKSPGDILKDLKELAQIYKELVEKLEEGPLGNEEAKILDILDNEVLNFLKQANSEAPYTLFNLEVANNLRIIANAKNSSLMQKDEALILLNEFVINDEITDKMLRDNFFVLKSSELVNEMLNSENNVYKLGGDIVELIEKDLFFMEHLTNNPDGVKWALESNTNELPLIDNLFKILLSEKDNEEFKIRALKVLQNLMKFGKDDKLDKRIRDEIKSLLDTNNKHYNLFTDLVDLSKTIIAKSDENMNEMKNKDILQSIKIGMQNYIESIELNEKVSNIILILSDKPEMHDYIFDSDILPALSTAFLKSDDTPGLDHDVIKSMLHLTFKKPSNKLKLINLGFIKGLVALLIKYSSTEFYNKEMVELVLKCMANFSIVNEGTKILLFDGIITAFRKFCKRYKKKLPDHMLLMLNTISNLTYEPNEENVKKILQDKGLELILDNLGYYTNLKNEVNAEAAIDALTHISNSQNTLKYLEKTKTDCIDILIDILREQLNDDLVYKALKCLTKFCEFKPLSDKLIEKRGQAITVDLFKTYAKDPKIIFQSLKFLNSLVKKYEDTLEEFLNCGIPEKIIVAFEVDWHVEIIKLTIGLFLKLAGLEIIKDVLGEQFLEYLLQVFEKYFNNKQIVRNGVKLLAICSDNITSVEIIKEKDGNKLADRILKKYLSSERITIENLNLMENMLTMNKESKPEYLDMKTDFKVENIIETTDKDTQREIHNKAIDVLNLLRDKKFKEIDISEMPESDDQDEDEEEIFKNSEQKKEKKDTKDTLEKKLPMDLQKFLKRGQILRVYGEDKVCRSMHFFLSKDMIDLKCKHPKENFVKQKWIIPIHQIKEVKYGYDKKSPIARSASFFRKAPSSEKCFAVFGPLTIDGDGVKNFHCLCSNSYNARKWFDYITLVVTEYKNLLKQNLKKNRNS